MDAIGYYTEEKKPWFIRLIFILPQAYAALLSTVVITVTIPLQNCLGKSALHLLA